MTESIKTAPVEPGYHYHSESNMDRLGDDEAKLVSGDRQIGAIVRHW